MHLVIHIPSENTLELNWTWLPTFIGMNVTVKEALEKEIGPKVQGRVLSEQFLQEIDEWIVAYLLKYFPLPGLNDYLRALLAVPDVGNDGG